MPKNRLQRTLDLKRIAAAAAAVNTGGGGGTGVTDHGALTGLADDDHTQYHTDARGDVRYVGTVTAGSGLTGGGTAGTVALHVGAGNGITVNADDVALASSVAGNGLTYSSGVLAVGVSGLGLGVGADAVTLTSSSAPGAAESILKSASDGSLQLVRLIATTNVNTPTVVADSTITLTPGTYVTLSDGKSIRTSTYSSGFAGSGFRLDQGVAEAAKTTLELDNLSVRGRMSVYELLIRQIRAHNGSLVVSDTGKVSAVSGSGPYTITTDPAHGFAVGDLIRAQRFTGTGTYQSNMQVTAVADVNNFTATLSSGDAPAVGHEFVRLGSVSDANRRGGIYLTASDTGAPFLDVWDDVDAFADWNTGTSLKARLGNLNGFYGYGARTYGFAAGVSGGAAITVDSTNGFRVVNNLTTVFQVDAAGNLRIKNSSGEDVISLLNDGTSQFRRPMTLHTDGGIYQGSGTFASPTTGLKIWNDSGTGRIGGYNGGNEQWSANTDGKLQFGGGVGSLSATGIRVIASTGTGTETSAYGITHGSSFAGGVMGLNNTGDNLNQVSLVANEFTAGTARHATVNIRAAGTSNPGTVNIDAAGSTASTINLKYAGTTRLTVDSGGVDIASALDVASTTTINADTGILRGAAVSSLTRTLSIGGARNTSGSDFARINFINYDNTTGSADYTGARISAQNDGTADDGGLYFYTADNQVLTEQMSIASGGNVDVVNELRAKLIRLDSSGTQSGVSGTTTFTAEYYGSVGSATTQVSLTGSTSYGNAGWVKFYVGTTACWFPYWTSV